MDGEPILESSGGGSWFLAALFLAGGSFVALLLAGIIGTGPRPTGAALVFAWVLAVSHVTAGAWLGVANPTVTLYTARRTLIVERRWPFFRRAIALETDRVAELVIAQSSDSDGDPWYRLEVRLDSGELVRTPPFNHRSLQDVEQAVGRIQACADRPLPAVRRRSD